jgi:hypothetical protein
MVRIIGSNQYHTQQSQNCEEVFTRFADKRDQRSMRLFVAKDREGINASSAECGNQAGRERYQNEEHGDRQKSYEVAGTHSVDQAGGNAAKSEGRDESDSDARQGGLHSLNDDQAPDVTQRGS